MTVSSIIFAQPVALASEGGSDPQWVELIPAGPEIVANDGRRFRNGDPQAIVDAFRARGRSLPVDVEHATQRRGDQGLDAPAYGWITKVEAREGAVWGLIEWSAQARDWLSTKAYRFISPAFRHVIASGDITRLEGAGLTNMPAFNMTALAREEPQEETDDMDKAVLEALGLAATATAADAVVAISKLKTDMATAREAAPDPKMWVPKAQHDATVTEVATLRADAAARSEADMVAAVDAGVVRGRILPAARDQYLAICKAIGIDAFRTMVDGMADRLPDPGLGDKQTTATAKAADISEDEMTICRLMGNDPKALATFKKEA